ncbi:MAG: hypothetical protein U5N58_02135 [Actinomycetota bacterium]|nr:hypothetical protein [Actinomycetota bacterium]
MQDKARTNIDDFMASYILKNADFELIQQGSWDRIEDPAIQTRG